jgi:hypothetical protein
MDRVKNERDVARIAGNVKRKMKHAEIYTCTYVQTKTSTGVERRTIRTIGLRTTVRRKIQQNFPGAERDNDKQYDDDEQLDDGTVTEMNDEMTVQQTDTSMTDSNRH